ncbi:MAG: FAD-dependent oxidoreductase [Victivallaceae bacterium]|nr:FAD-dependent oxidoreductase [Victivallaceae bacterium]
MKFFAVLLAVVLGAGLAAAEYEADVVVYGGSSGGMIAAAAAAKAGKKVLVAESSGHVGGMTAGGLGLVDIMRRETLGGLTLEFFRRAANVPGGRMYRVTPKLAETVFLRMAGESGVELLLNRRLAEQGGVEKDGGAITAIRFENGDRATGKIFIDASYEGDLLAAAGVKHRVGREAVAEYGEPAAGVRPAVRLKYGEAKDAAGKLCADLVSGEPGTVGAADGLTQAYNFRLCMTQDRNNFKAVPKPEGYDRGDYRNLLNWLASDPGKAWRFDNVVSYWELLSGGTKIDANNNGDFSTDFINHSHNWAEASYAERQKIYDEHRRYTQGFLYFLANDYEVPEDLRKDCASWGLAADEFVDNDNWPYMLYVREARRMTGEYVMTQYDCYQNNLKADSIGIGSYMLDSHAVRKFAAADGSVYMEGFISVFDGKVPVRPYEIPYRALTPRRDDCSNLLAVICLSASHVAYCSLRMEPVFMTAGEAAGTAAAMAVDGDLAVQDIDVAALQKKLTDGGGILHYPAKGNMFPLSAELDGYVLDDRQAKLTGRWAHREVGVPMLDGRYAMVYSSVPSTAEYEWTVPEDGRYTMGVILPRTADGKVMPVIFKQNNREYKLKCDLSKVGTREEILHRFPARQGDRITVIFSNGGKAINAVADGIVFRKQVRP